MSFWELSYVAMWVWLLALTVLCVSMLRQVGVLLLRVGQIAPASVGTGPRVGTQIDLAYLHAANGSKRLAAARGRLLVIFATPGCGACTELLPALRALQEQRDDVSVRIVLDASDSEAANWLQRAPNELTVVPVAGVLAKYEVQGTPYACVTDLEGRVLSGAGVNHLDHLESLLARTPTSMIPRELPVSDMKGAPTPVTRRGME